MVTVKILVVFVSVVLQGCVAWPQEIEEVSPPPPATPPILPTPTPSVTTTATPTYTTQPTTYPPTAAYVEPPTTYPPTTYPPTTYVPTTYPPTTASTKEPDYGTPYFDYTWHYDSDYDEGDGYDKVEDVVGHYGLTKDEFFKEMGLPWVYVIMPVIEVEVYYVNEEEHGVESVGFELPVETILLDLLQFGEAALGELMFGWEAEDEDDYSYSYHHSHGHSHYGADYDVPGVLFDLPATLYDRGDELFDPATLDYPAGIDHDTAWVDWLFQPANQFI